MKLTPNFSFQKCKGTCDFSSSGGPYFQYTPDDKELPMFDIDYNSDCECCQATMEAAVVKFRCSKWVGEGELANEVVTIVDVNVTSITDCNCMQCR